MKIIETSMRFRVIEMTPEFAQELLDKNHPNNRRPKRGKITQYVADMEGGFWQLTHQPVAVDVDGFLVDGQNRLAAIIRYGKSVPVVFVTGVPRKAILGVDCGTNRNVADMARIKGEPLPHGAMGFSAVARRMLIGLGAGSWSAPTIQHVLDFIKIHQEALEFSFEVFGAGKNKTGITQAPVRAAIARAWYRRNSRSRIKEFAEVLISGLPDDPKRDSAAIRLRNWLLENFTSGQRGRASKRPVANIVYAKTEVALTYFLKGEPCESLKETRHELFPLDDDPAPAREDLSAGLRIAN